MTSTQTVGTVPPASAATMLRFTGNCPTAISVTALDAVHIELELRLLPRRLPREGAMTIGPASIDASDDDALGAALHGAAVTSRVHLIEDAVLVVDTNSDGVIQAAACRVQPMPVIVRFLPVLQ